MDFLVITHIPTRQGLLGPIKERNIIEESSANDLEELKEGLHIPLDGYCLVVEREHVTKIESRIHNEFV